MVPIAFVIRASTISRVTVLNVLTIMCLMPIQVMAVSAVKDTIKSMEYAQHVASTLFSMERDVSVTKDIISSMDNAIIARMASSGIIISISVDLFAGKTLILTETPVHAMPDLI
jgi:hypothetical protein